MKEIAINIKARNEPGVLNDISALMASSGINITYTHLFIEDKDSGSIYMELEDVENIDMFIDLIKSFEAVQQVEIHRSLSDIYGKRIMAKFRREAITKHISWQEKARIDNNVKPRKLKGLCCEQGKITGHERPRASTRGLRRRSQVSRVIGFGALTVSRPHLCFVSVAP